MLYILKTSLLIPPHISAVSFIPLSLSLFISSYFLQFSFKSFGFSFAPSSRCARVCVVVKPSLKARLSLLWTDSDLFLFNISDKPNNAQRREEKESLISFSGYNSQEMVDCYWVAYVLYSCMFKALNDTGDGKGYGQE